MYERNNHIGSTILAFALGGLIGAAVALLMAPQSGRETRSMIMNKSNELKERAVETVDETRTKAEKAIDDLAHQTKDRVSTLRDRGQEMMDEKLHAIKKSM
jgi:gas vesicle protein